VGVECGAAGQVYYIAPFLKILLSIVAIGYFGYVRNFAGCNTVGDTAGQLHGVKVRNLSYVGS
jgi:hypothetical protein